MAGYPGRAVALAVHQGIEVAGAGRGVGATVDKSVVGPQFFPLAIFGLIEARAFVLGLHALLAGQWAAGHIENVLHLVQATVAAQIGQHVESGRRHYRHNGDEQC